jgi:hypothetical protein
MYFDPKGIALRDGYQNAPIPFAWLRAPYLHNGSVPTLSALIGLTDREDDQRGPKRFCRGRNAYDPIAVGLEVVRPGADGTCPDRLPFLFDTSKDGNFNGGHEFPKKDTVDRAGLESLLAYLRTL